jgi:serine/threonine-protein kinase RsbW
MEFPAELSHLPEMLSLITSFLKKQSVSSSNIKRIELACEEAIVNVISYAYPNDGHEKKIFMELKNHEKGVFEIIFRDNGEPFDICQAKAEIDHHIPLSERKIGGLGIFLMRKLVDKIDYERKEGQNVLKFTFRLT